MVRSDYLSLAVVAFGLCLFPAGRCAAQSDNLSPGWHPISPGWHQGSGPNGDFRVAFQAPTAWSVATNSKIAWRISLPETGQSTPVIVDNRVFVSTLKPCNSDSELGQDIIGWCFDAQTGEELWHREIDGVYPLRLSGCFGDSSSPPALCDGERVLFVSASGAIACFDLDGNPLWQRNFLTVNRTLPFLHQGNVILTRQIYPPDPNGVFPHRYAESPKEDWTQLQAIDLATGKDVWTTQCGVNMGCAITPQRLNDGTDVAVVGRGGGHGPPEKPDGVSMIDLADGSTRWSLPLKKFMATMNFPVRDDVVHLFHHGDHLSVNAKTGKVERKSSIIDSVTARVRHGDQRKKQTASLTIGKNKRMITQTSNLLVGKWHYFRSYVRPWLGRVNVETGKTEYLELPIQLARTTDGQQQLAWYVEPKTKRDTPLKAQAIIENAMKNSRDMIVMGDPRSKGNGWGHVASPSPSVAGDHLYVPVQNGTVYVIRWDSLTLDESAIVAINDLGPAGDAYTRSSLSFADGKAYAHTIRELICIGEK